MPHNLSRDDEYRREKARELLRLAGCPMMCYPHETEQAVGRIKELHAAGMAFTAMAKQTGLNDGTFSRYCRDETQRMLRSSYDKIMSMEYEAPGENTTSPQFRARSGAHVASLGARRRLQALCAAGYPGIFMADWLNWPRPMASRFMRGKSGATFIYAYTDQAVRAMYAKLENSKPADFGITPLSEHRAKNRAKANDWAPPIYWDDDTIDDPDGFPEWTGHCGTIYGLTLHRRRDIPTCDACRRANATARKVNRQRLSRERKEGRKSA